MKLSLVTVDKVSLELYKFFLRTLFTARNIKPKDVSFFDLPVHVKRFTVLKSPHVHKKARDQYEIRTYKSIVTFKNYTETLDFKNLIKFLILNKPSSLKLSLEYIRQGSSSSATTTATTNTNSSTTSGSN